MPDKTLQEKFLAFASSPEGAMLSDLESKALVAFYGAADPATSLVRLSVIKIARKLRIRYKRNIKPLAVAVDSLTAKGILETITPGDHLTATPAVRKLTFGKPLPNPNKSVV